MEGKLSVLDSSGTFLMMSHDQSETFRFAWWEVLLAILLAAIPLIGWIVAFALIMDALGSGKEISLSPHDNASACAGSRSRLGAGLVDLGVILAISGLPYLGWFCAVFYAFFRDTPLLGGRSVGKRCFGLVQIESGGGSRSGGVYLSAVRRNFLIASPVLQILGGMVEAWFFMKKSTGERVGDRWAGTKVVHCRPT